MDAIRGSQVVRLNPLIFSHDAVDQGRNGWRALRQSPNSPTPCASGSENSVFAQNPIVLAGASKALRLRACAHARAVCPWGNKITENRRLQNPRFGVNERYGDLD